MLVYHYYKINMPYHNNFTHAHTTHIVILDDECKWALLPTTMLQFCPRNVNYDFVPQFGLLRLIL